MGKLVELLTLVYTEEQKKFYEIIEHKLNKNEKTFVITANPEIISIGATDLEMEVALRNSSYIIADGIGVAKAIKWKLKKKCERNTGIELVWHILDIANEKSLSCFFYGAKKEVLEDVLRLIEEKYPQIRVLDAVDGYSQDKEFVRKKVVESKADIILIALGTPNQEKFINSFYDKIDKGVCVGVGGSFDVIGGHVKRAPQFFVRNNLEWLYRITMQPSRLKRFWRGNILFVFKLMFGL